MSACGVLLALQADLAHSALIELDPNDSSQSVVLSDLINGTHPGIIVGDKVFSDFFYSTLPGDDMPDASAVTVFGFRDTDNNWGMSLRGAFLDLPGGGPSAALLRFTVEVETDAVASGLRISDAHLFAGGVGVGDDSVLTIDETFENNSTQSLNVFATTLGGQPEQRLSDWVDFDELTTSMRVTKEIFALASNNGNLPARVGVIDQSFSQVVVPEPATWCLMMIGAAGIAMRRKQIVG